MNLTTQSQPEVRSGLISNILVGAKLLIVCDDDSETEKLQVTLRQAGFDAECAKSMTAACEIALSGQFQVVVSAPRLRDGSWRRLTDLAARYNFHFEVVLWAHNFDLRDWAEALNEGAFDVLDAVYDQSTAVEAAKCALWSAYLKGAGPNARAVSPYKVA